MSKLETNQVDPSTGTTLTLGTSGDTISIPSGVTIANSGTATGFSTPGISSSADATAMTITANENVGIGITDPDSYESSARELVVGKTSGAAGITVRGATESNIYFADGTTGAEKYAGYVQYDHNNNNLNLGGSGVTRIRIDSNGDYLQNTTSTSRANIGNKFFSGNGGITVVSQDPNLPMQLNRLNQDGVIVNFLSQSTVEGTISVSGTTVSYNGFTGTHWSRFTDNSTPSILRGTVLETLDEMCDWYNLEFDVTDENENIYKEKIPHVLVDGQSVGDTVTYNHNGIDYQATIIKEGDIKHMKSKVSDTVDAKNIYGVFVAYDEDGEGYNDFYVASVGSFVVRIKSGQTIAKGDLLQSNGDGTAKVQSDDNVKSSSFAKVLSTTVIETYEDGSFIVPCSLMC